MGLLNVGARALMANQVALQTAGNNIANVNTPGYSRQTVALQTVQGQFSGAGYIGQGVDVRTILRNQSELLTRQAAAAGSVSAGDTVRAQRLSQLQEIFSGGPTGLGAAITDMMNAFSDVVAAPTDLSARTLVLTRMDETASRMRTSADRINEIQYTVTEELKNSANTVNSLAKQMAAINEQIARATGNGQTPNDLLDQREQVIREINQYVQTTQIPADDGTIGLFVGGSQPLVLGTTATEVAVGDSGTFPSSGQVNSGQVKLLFTRPGSPKIELDENMLGGGSISGLLRFNNTDLAEGRNLLGRLAMTIGHELNLQNQRGLTLNGQQGGALFSLPSTSTGYGNITGYSNIGPGAATTQVMDASQLKPSDYRLIFEGSPVAPVLTRMSDGKVFNATSTPPLNMGNLATGFDADGLRFIVPAATLAAAVSGNSMLFKPFSTAASEIEALVHNPDELAAASALTANINKNNTGKLQLTQLGANDFTGIPAAQDPVRLTFDGAGQVTYQIYDHLSSTWSAASAPMDYTPGQPITINGWSITLTGTPAAGDTVDVANALDFGEAFRLNAGNAGAFLDLRDKKVFDQGTTLSDGFSAAMAVVGTRTQSVQLAEKLSSTVAKNLEMDRTAVSGVNLDEEAARLLQYQQAYQASSKVIQIAQSLFDSVLNAVGR